MSALSTRRLMLYTNAISSQNSRHTRMIHFRRSLICVLCSFILAGCAAMIAPTSAERASADCGEYPDNYRGIVNNWIHRTFFDPYSIQDLSITTPEKYFIQQPPLLGGGRLFGYRVRVAANAKNRLGGYTGLQTTNVLIRNGKVVYQWAEGELPGSR